VVGLVLLALLGKGFSVDLAGARLQKLAAQGGLWWSGVLGFVFALSFCPVSAGLYFGALLPLAAGQGSRLLVPGLFGVGTALPVVAFAFLIAFGGAYVGRAFDRLIDEGATAIFEETGELIGCEHLMARRAATPELGRAIVDSVAKAARYYQTLGHSSFAPGNAEGGLTTIEEKSLGAYSKSGKSPISGLVKPGDVPPRGGLYLLDVVPDGEVRFGFPNIADNAEIVELAACGSHLVIFTTGRGSVVGSAVSPVVKVCANPETYRNLADDMDVDAGRILEGRGTLDDVGREIHDLVLRTADGQPTASERLGHQEFLLTYKSFEPIGPGCLSGA
jgi:altronate hydrolase